jgi:hypothetical protein
MVLMRLSLQAHKDRRKLQERTRWHKRKDQRNAKLREKYKSDPEYREKMLSRKRKNIFTN